MSSQVSINHTTPTLPYMVAWHQLLTKYGNVGATWQTGQLIFLQRPSVL